MGTLDATEGYKTFFRYCKQVSSYEIEEKCQQIWEKDCKNFIYKDALNLFNKYKKDGFITIMVDAGISQLYNDFLKFYKFDYVFTTSLEFKNGLSTGKLKGKPCSNMHKYKIIKKLIEDKGDSLNDVIFYANSHNDIPLLEKVGKPIAVNPNKKLRLRARKDGWKILRFKEVVKTENFIKKA